MAAVPAATLGGVRGAAPGETRPAAPGVVLIAVLGAPRGAVRGAAVTRTPGVIGPPAPDLGRVAESGGVRVLPTVARAATRFRWWDGGGRWSRPCRICWEAAQSACAAADRAPARSAPTTPAPRPGPPTGRGPVQPDLSAGAKRPARAPARLHLVPADRAPPSRRTERDGPAAAPRSGAVRAARPARAPRRDAGSTRSPQWHGATRPAPPPCVRAPAGPRGR